jgi:hypothetical protein
VVGKVNISSVTRTGDVYEGRTLAVSAKKLGVGIICAVEGMERVLPRIYELQRLPRVEITEVENAERVRAIDPTASR